MTMSPRKHRRILVFGAYIALALFACAEIHMLTPALFHGPTCDRSEGTAPGNVPDGNGNRHPCALCVLVQTATLLPPAAIADAPPVALSDESAQEFRAVLWCDSTWTPESLRGPPSFDTV